MLLFLLLSSSVSARAAEWMRLPPIEPVPLGEEVPVERLPLPEDRFPSLPPNPYANQTDPLPSLADELWLHGGSYLYAPEGDRLGWPDEQDHAHFDLLRLPEDWQKPRPITRFQQFLGTDPVRAWPRLKWPGREGFAWEPRLVISGSYEIFAIALESGGQRHDGIGHQLLLDVDLRLTGTERFHVQWRPLGRKNSGGSVFQLSDPSFYDDNSTGAPDRYWFEGELYSVLGGLFDDPFVPRDYNIVVGRFPLALHNNLLLNDDIGGIAISKNTLLIPPLSNLNLQAYYAIDDVDAFPGASADLVGLNLFADWHHAFIEMSLAYLAHGQIAARDASYAAISVTQFFGPLSIAGRGLFKWGDAAGTGDGQLFVLESNYTRRLGRNLVGIEDAVFYVNAFRATRGWNSISGGNFDRIRSSFAVNPLVRIAAVPDAAENYGVAAGVQLFRHHQDESLVPEIAIEAPDDQTRYGVGLRYLRKTGPRSYLELLGVLNFSDADPLDREGVFLSHFIML